MLQDPLRYWCLLLLCSIMLCSASFLPHSISSQRVPDMNNVVQTLEDDHHKSPIVKRFSDKGYASFYRLMSKHGRYKNEQAFVEKMFRLFDMNSDQVIERDEFKAILQLLGIISHSY